MRVRMLQTIEEREGDRNVTFAKGSLVNVSDAQGSAWIADGAAERDEDPDASKSSTDHAEA